MVTVVEEQRSRLYTPLQVRSPQLATVFDVPYSATRSRARRVGRTTVKGRVITTSVMTGRIESMGGRMTTTTRMKIVATTVCGLNADEPALAGQTQRRPPGDEVGEPPAGARDEAVRGAAARRVSRRAARCSAAGVVHDGVMMPDVGGPEIVRCDVLGRDRNSAADQLRRVGRRAAGNEAVGGRGSQPVEVSSDADRASAAEQGSAAAASRSGSYSQRPSMRGSGINDMGAASTPVGVSMLYNSVNIIGSANNGATAVAAEEPDDGADAASLRNDDRFAMSTHDPPVDILVTAQISSESVLVAVATLTDDERETTLTNGIVIPNVVLREATPMPSLDDDDTRHAPLIAPMRAIENADDTIKNLAEEIKQINMITERMRQSLDDGITDEPAMNAMRRVSRGLTLEAADLLALEVTQHPALIVSTASVTPAMTPPKDLSKNFATIEHAEEQLHSLALEIHELNAMTEEMQQAPNIEQSPAAGSSTIASYLSEDEANDKAGDRLRSDRDNGESSYSFLADDDGRQVPIGTRGGGADEMMEKLPVDEIGFVVSAASSISQPHTPPQNLTQNFIKLENAEAELVTLTQEIEELTRATEEIHRNSLPVSTAGTVDYASDLTSGIVDDDGSVDSYGLFDAKRKPALLVSKASVSQPRTPPRTNLTQTVVDIGAAEKEIATLAGEIRELNKASETITKKQAAKIDAAADINAAAAALKLNMASKEIDRQSRIEKTIPGTTTATAEYGTSQASSSDLNAGLVNDDGSVDSYGLFDAKRNPALLVSKASVSQPRTPPTTNLTQTVVDIGAAEKEIATLTGEIPELNEASETINKKKQAAKVDAAADVKTTDSALPAAAGVDSEAAKRVMKYVDTFASSDGT